MADRGGVAVGRLEYRRHAVARRPVRLPPRPTGLVGRERLLEEMDARLDGGDFGPRVVVLSGFGGVGKTSLALEYAYRHVAGLGLAWQFPAEDAAALAVAFTELAAQLGVHDLLGAADPVAEVHAVLAAYQEDWLLLFDNAADATAVRSVLPPAGNGRVIITSQNPHWPAGQAVDVPVLELETAAQFLADRTGTADRKASRELAADLGGLPLALEQAGAYMQATGRTMAEYLALFRQRSAEMLARGEPAGYDRRVASTWSMAFERIRHDGDAVSLLRLLACCAPDAVPLDRLLRPGKKEKGLGDEGIAQMLGGLMHDPLAVDDAVGALRRYSLIGPMVHGSVTIHRLVQAVTLGQMDDGLAAAWRRAAASLIEASLSGAPAQPENWPVYAALLPHTLAAVADDSPTMEAVAGYLASSGDYAAARSLQQQVLEARERRLGPEHPETVTARANLAERMGDAGDYAGACHELAELLPVMERGLGAKHRQTLAARAELAEWTGDAGDFTGARDQLAGLVPILGEVLGEDDATALSARGKLAYWTGASGDAAGARDQFAALWPVIEACLGAEHPETLRTRANLAWWTGQAGDTAGSLAHGAALIPVFRRVLGEEHPETLAVRADHAFWTGKAGNAAGARDEYAALLPVAERVLGEAHPEVLTLRANLAGWTGETGDAAGARDQYAALVPAAERAFGPEHPKTISMRADLASWTGRAG